MTPEEKYNEMIKRKKLQADKYFIEDLFSQKNISLAPRILQKVDSLNPNIHTANGNSEVFRNTKDKRENVFSYIQYNLLNKKETGREIMDAIKKH